MDVFGWILLSLVIGLIVGALLGVVIAFRVRPSSPIADPQVAAEQAQAAAAETQQRARELATIEARAAAAEATVTELREQVGQLRELQQNQQRAQTKAQEEDSKVLQALAPVQENLRTMQQKITELEAQRQSQYGSLSHQLTEARQAEQELRKTTASLAGALQSNSVRGAWGEAQLRNIVESAGLTERVDFNMQSSISGENGRLRPDMILNIPGGKCLPIDAKVPFSAYIKANEIPANAAPDEVARRDALLSEHVKAVRSHIDALAAKSYWAGLPSPDFVVAFIPSESLLSAALDVDPALLDYAFNKRVALASPVTLWSVLKTVAYTWQQEMVTEEAKKLFDLSRELYDRLGVLAGHAERLSRSIESTVVNYNKFASSLETRVLVTARKLSIVDESKVIGETRSIDEAPHTLTAAELSITAADSEPAEPEPGAETKATVTGPEDQLT